MIATVIRNTLLAIPVASAVAMNDAKAAGGVEIQELKSEKGLKVLLVEDYTVPLVAMAFSFKGGTTQDEKGFEGTAQMLTTMLDEGAGELDSQELQRKLDDVGVRYRFSAARDTFSGSMKSLIDNLDESAELMANMINEPRFDEEPFARMMGVAVQGLKREETNPSALSAKAMRETIFENHPYRRPPKGTLETVKAITPEVLRRYHERIFAKDNLTIGIVGAVNAEDAKKLVDRIFAQLPPTSELGEVAEFTIKTGEEKHVEFNVPQTTITLALNGMKRNDPDFYAAVLVNHILGGRGFDSRLFNEVREKRGLAYGAYSALATFDHGGMIQAGSATGKERANETIKIISEELKRMADEGPTQEELENAKKYIIGAYGVQNLDTSDKIASVLVAVQEAKLGTDYIKKREGYLGSVTIEDAKRVSERLYGEVPTLITVGQKTQ